MRGSLGGVWEQLRRRYLQDTQGLEAPEGSLCDVADGIVAQTESVEISQHGQSAFIQTRQVVVRQISGERNRARDRRGWGADGEEERKEMGGRKRNVLCEVWKEKTGWQNSEAPCNVIRRNLIADSVAYLPLSDVFFHLALFFTTRCQQRMGPADPTAQVRSRTFDGEEKSFWAGACMSTTSTSNPT